MMSGLTADGWQNRGHVVYLEMPESRGHVRVGKSRSSGPRPISELEDISSEQSEVATLLIAHQARSSDLTTCRMAKAANSPSAPPATLKKSTSGSQSSRGQMSIAGFFKRQATLESNNAGNETSQATLLVNGNATKATTRKRSQDLTPAPSSDAIDQPDSPDPRLLAKSNKEVVIGLPSPITPAGVTDVVKQEDVRKLPFGFSSPSRKVTSGDPAFNSRVDDYSSTGKESRQLCRV